MIAVDTFHTSILFCGHYMTEHVHACSAWIALCGNWFADSKSSYLMSMAIVEAHKKF